ncbi:MAG: hypothetical protein Q9187_006961 [Circinaria calcarea]
MVYKEMEPPIGQSIGLIKPGFWSIGTLMSCEQLQGQPPEDAVAHWKDGDTAFCLRPKLPNTSSTGDSAIGKFYDRGTCSAAWNLSSNVICKATSWVQGMEAEGKTIEFVVKHVPSVPVPEVIYHWVDPAWDRSFILERRVPGERLNEVWSRISHEQRVGVAAQLAEHAVSLAKLKSRRCEKATGAGITYESTLLGGVPWEDRPSWKPLLHTPLTAGQVTARIVNFSGEAPPDLGEYFLFAHTTMNPTNVFIIMPAEETGHVQVSAILGWASAGFYPHWWISTTPRVHAGFALDTEFIDDPPQDQWDWMWILSDALIRKGFPCEDKWFMQNMFDKEKIAAEQEAREQREARAEQE